MWGFSFRLLAILCTRGSALHFVLVLLPVAIAFRSLLDLNAHTSVFGRRSWFSSKRGTSEEFCGIGFCLPETAQTICRVYLFVEFWCRVLAMLQCCGSIPIPIPVTLGCVVSHSIPGLLPVHTAFRCLNAHNCVLGRRNQIFRKVEAFEEFW